MLRKRSRTEMRRIRHLRLRQKLSGTAEAPRLAVFRSLKHIYAQVIDDNKGTTLVAVSTREKSVAEQLKGTGNIEAAKFVGKLVAERALEKGIQAVVFDRGGHMFHGRVKALADSAREAGLKF